MNSTTKLLLGYLGSIAAVLAVAAVAETVSDAKEEAIAMAKENAETNRTEDERDIFRRRDQAAKVVREIERHEEAINADQESKLRAAMDELKPAVNDIFKYESDIVAAEKKLRQSAYDKAKKACDDILSSEKRDLEFKLALDTKYKSLKVARDALAKAGEGTKNLNKQINEYEEKVKKDILQARSESAKKTFEECEQAKKALDGIDAYRKDILGQRTPEETELVAKWTNLQRELSNKTTRMKKIRDNRTVDERKAAINLSDLNSQCDDILRGEASSIDKKTAYAQYLASKGATPTGVAIVGFLPLIPVFLVVKRYVLWVLDFASKVRCPA